MMSRLQSIERPAYSLEQADRLPVDSDHGETVRTALSCHAGRREAKWGPTNIRPVADISRRGDFRMRGILLAMLVAAGIGLAGSAGVSAAPTNGAAIGNAADETSQVTTVQHWRWGSRGGHWRWGSRGGH